MRFMRVSAFAEIKLRATPFMSFSSPEQDGTNTLAEIRDRQQKG